jgi:hydrogenase maturation protease
VARAPVVVIGVGNPMRADDAAGIAVVRRLRVRAGVRLLEQSGEATALLDALRGAPAALVVDAARGPQPGRVRRLDAAAQSLPPALFACSTHGFGVAEGIELARALGALPPVCVVYALEGAQFETGAAMSPAMQAAVAAVAARVEMEIDAMQHGHPGAVDA